MFGFFRTRALTTQQEQLIEKHLPALYRRSKQILTADDYGIVNRKALIKWYDEKQHFSWNILRIKYNTRLMTDVAGSDGTIDRLIREYSRTIDTQNTKIHGPADYEAKCAQFLQTAGWSTTLTKNTGDQGADVIAEKGSRKMVVQCKYYAKAVGNKAVQEVVAAKDFFGADLALVVAPNGFTKAAQELASSNRVFLRHHTELSQFDENAATSFSW